MNFANFVNAQVNPTFNHQLTEPLLKNEIIEDTVIDEPTDISLPFLIQNILDNDPENIKDIIDGIIEIKEFLEAEIEDL
jgi:hypothetical protein